MYVLGAAGMRIKHRFFFFFLSRNGLDHRVYIERKFLYVQTPQSESNITRLEHLIYGSLTGKKNPTLEAVPVEFLIFRASTLKMSEKTYLNLPFTLLVKSWVSWGFHETHRLKGGYKLDLGIRVFSI